MISFKQQIKEIIGFHLPTTAISIPPEIKSEFLTSLIINTIEKKIDERIEHNEKYRGSCTDERIGELNALRDWLK